LPTWRIFFFNYYCYYYYYCYYNYDYYYCCCCCCYYSLSSLSLLFFSLSSLSTISPLSSLQQNGGPDHEEDSLKMRVPKRAASTQGQKPYERVTPSKGRTAAKENEPSDGVVGFVKKFIGGFFGMSGRAEEPPTATTVPSERPSNGLSNGVGGGHHQTPAPATSESRRLSSNAAIAPSASFKSRADDDERDDPFSAFLKAKGTGKASPQKTPVFKFPVVSDSPSKLSPSLATSLVTQTRDGPLTLHDISERKLRSPSNFSVSSIPTAGLLSPAPADRPKINVRPCFFATSPPRTH